MFRPIRIFILFFALFIANKGFSQFPYEESFKNAAPDNPGSIIFGGGNNPLTEGFAFLTANVDSALKYGATPEPVGDGYLRLTNNKQYQKGYIYNKDIRIPSANGLKIEFEYYTYTPPTADPKGADGICFFLFDTDVLPNFQIGGFGGSLGYAQYHKEDHPDGPQHLPGVSGGYIGVGLDEFGYFSRTFEGRSAYLDGTPVYSHNQQGSVVIRGKGNGDAVATENYPLLVYKKTGDPDLNFNLVGGDGLRREPDPTKYGYRRASIILERNPAGGFNISVDIYEGTNTGLVRHEVIKDFHYNEVAPERLGYGISASSGQNVNYHEIRNLKIELYDTRPLGMSDEVTTVTNVPVDINVKTNDIPFNPAGANLMIIQDAANPQPTNGTITIVDEDAGIIKYTPNPVFSGTDHFTYILVNKDTGKESFPIPVTVKVYPVGTDDDATTPVNTPVTIDVKDNDASKNGTTVVNVTNPANGTVTVNNNQVIYTPNNGYQGPDQFTYQLETADGLPSATITVNVVVTPGPLVPAKIGLAKALIGLDKNIDGSFNVKYRFTIVKIGDISVENLSLQDDLAATFQQDATFSVKSVTVVQGALLANNSFDGTLDTELLAAGSILGPQSKAEIDVELVVSISKDEATYNNIAIVRGNPVGSPGTPLEDTSTNGFTPDPVVPGDFSPKDPTPTPLKKVDLFIPEGFSPNNDGIHDYFVIENTSGKTLSLEIYNRWGNAVYKSADYKNDWGGKCTEGIHIGEDVPTGTYYYIVKIGDEKKVGFITVNR